MHRALPTCRSYIQRVAKRPLQAISYRSVSSESSQNHLQPQLHTDKASYPSPLNATTTSLSSAIANATFAPKNPPHIFELTREQISEFTDLPDLERFVSEIESAPTLTFDHLGGWILPLSRLTSLKYHGAAGAQLTERLLATLLKRLPSHPDDRTDAHVIPPTQLYNRCLIAWGNTISTDHTSENVHHVERIFQCQLDQYLNDSQRHDPPTRTSFKSRIRAWAAAGEPARASSILRQEVEVYSGIPKLLGESTHAMEEPLLTLDELPDLAMYNIVAMAYAKSAAVSHSVRIQRVLEIYQRVEQLQQGAVGRRDDYELDGHSYTALLLAHARYLSVVGDDPTGITQLETRIQKLLHRIYDRILVLQESTEYKHGTFEAKRVLDGNVYGKSEKEGPLFPLDLSWAYGVWIKVLLKSSTVESIGKAEQVIYDMTTGSSERKVHQCIPNQATVASVTNALARYNENEERIYRLLRTAVLTTKFHRIHELNNAMSKWADLPSPQHRYVPELLESMISQALEAYKGKKNKPTGFTFLLAMRSWLRCSDFDGAPDRLEQLFLYMVKLYEIPDRWYVPMETHVRCLFTAHINRCHTGQKYLANGHTLFPSEHCERILEWVTTKSWLTKNKCAGFCGMTLRALSLQNGIDDFERLDRSVALLNRFFEGEATIPSYPTNWILASCTKPFASREIRQHAYNTASELFVRKDVGLNHRSYELMARVVQHQYYNSGDDNEIKAVLIRELFHRACAAGLLSQNMVMIFVENIRQQDVIQKVFGLDFTYSQMVVQYSQQRSFTTLPRPLLLANLPSEWSCNVKAPREPPVLPR